MLYNLVIDDTNAMLLLVKDASFNDYLIKGFMSGSFLACTITFKVMLRNFYRLILRLLTLSDSVSISDEHPIGSFSAYHEEKI